MEFRRVGKGALATCPPSIDIATLMVGTRRSHLRDPAGPLRWRSVVAQFAGVDVVGEVDLEEAGVDLLGRVQIVDRNRGVVALRVGHRPLLELAVLDADHQHQPAGADQGLLLLDGDADEDVIGRDVDDIGVLQQIDPVRQQEAQRRLRQRIDVLGRKLRIAHRQRRSVGDDRDRAGRIVLETHLARLLDVEIALGLAAVGADLDEISDQRLQRGQIGTHLGSLRLLVGVEGCKNIGRDIAVRIGNHRVRRRLGGAGGRSAPCPARSSARCRRGPSGAGFRNRHGLRESRRREACNGRGDQKGQSGAQPAMGGVVVSSGISDLYSTRHPAAGHFIVLSTKGDIVFP